MRGAAGARARASRGSPRDSSSDPTSNESWGAWAQPFRVQAASSAWAISSAEARWSRVASSSRSDCPRAAGLAIATQRASHRPA